MTKTVKELIIEGIKEHKTTDRYTLCEYVAYYLEFMHEGPQLVHYTIRNECETTKKILMHIDDFMVGADLPGVVNRKLEIEKYLNGGG